MSKRSLFAAVAVLALVLGACGTDTPTADPDEGTGAAQSPTPDAEGSIVVITATDYEFDLPETLPAGPTTFSLTNAGEEPHFIDIVELTDDAPPVDKLIKMSESKVGGFFVGQPNTLPTVKPGETGEKTVEIMLESGARYGYVCFIEAKDGTPHAFLGMSGEFTVE